MKRDEPKERRFQVDERPWEEFLPIAFADPNRVEGDCMEITHIRTRRLVYHPDDCGM
jgi:hypothetical protein